MIYLGILLGIALLAGALRVGYVVGYRTAERSAEDTLRAHVERTRAAGAWEAGIPNDCIVEAVTLDGRHLLTGPVPASFLHPHRAGFGARIFVAEETTLRVLVSCARTGARLVVTGGPS